MKDEYDFSSAERGRFHRPGATFVAPVHLDPELLGALTTRAAAENVTLSELVNALLRETIRRSETRT